MSPKPSRGDSEKTDQGKKNRARRRIRLLASLFYLTALLLAFLYVAPKLLFHGEKYIPLVEERLSELTGAEVTIGNIGINLLAGPQVTLDDVSIARDGRPVVSARRIKAGVHLSRSILEKSVRLDRLDVIEPMARIERRADGTYNIALPGGDDAGTAEADGSQAAAALLGAFRRVEVKGGAFYWTDRKAAPDSPFHAYVSDIDLHIAWDTLLGPGSVRLSFRAHGPRDAADFGLSGGFSYLGGGLSGVVFNGGFSLDEADAALVWPYVEPYLPFEKLDAVVSWKGSLDGGLSSGFTSRGDIRLESVMVRYPNVYSADISRPEASLSYNASFKEDSLSFDELRLAAGGVRLSASGGILGVRGPDPVLSISMSTNMMDIGEVTGYLPDKALAPQANSFLKENVESGRAALSNLSFKGSVSRLEDMSAPGVLRSLSGTLKVADLGLRFEGLLHSFEDVNGSVTLRNNSLILAGVKGRYGASALEEISGTVKDIDQAPSFRLYVRGGVDFAEAAALVAEKVSHPAFRRQMKKVRRVEGTMFMDAEISGDTRDLASTFSARGKARLADVGFETALFDLPVRGVGGEIEGRTDDFTIKELFWEAGDSFFILTGNVGGLTKQKPSYGLELMGAVALEDMNKIRFLRHGRAYSQSGYAALDLGIKGAGDTFALDYTLDMTNAEYGLGGAFHKPMGFVNHYLFTGSVKEGNQVKIDRLTAYLGESRLDLTGRVGRFLRGEGIDLSIASDGVLLDDLDPVLKKTFADIESGGYIAGKVSISDGGEDIPVSLSGKFYIQNADFKLRLFRGAFRNVDGEVELLDNRIFLKKGSGRFGEGRFNVAGSGIFYREKPEFNLNVEADSLHLIDFFREPGMRREPRPDKKRPYLDGVWKVSVKSKEGTIGMLTYQDLNAAMRYEDRRFHVEPLSFLAHGGRWSWKGDITIREDKKIAIDSELMAQDIRLERFMTEALKTGKKITGPLNIRGPIRSVGDGMDEIKRNLEGRLEASAGAGVIHKFKVLARIFSLINVTGYLKLKPPDLDEGMPFNSITANFDIKDGVATTGGLFVDSDAMRMMAVGDYDIADKQIAMTVGVMPLPTWDKVISSIPLVGGVLTGKEKSLLASYYEVTGDIADPKVKPVPIESLAAGVAGILKRLIELPVTTIKKLDEALTPSGKKTPAEKAK